MPGKIGVGQTPETHRSLSDIHRLHCARHVHRTKRWPLRQEVYNLTYKKNYAQGISNMTPKPNE